MDKLVRLLESMIDLLEEEKLALIRNDGEKINEILISKNEFIKNLENYRGKNLSDKEEVVALVNKIDELQETNLMLTNQAINYNNFLLDLVKDMTKDKTGGYSKDGKITESSNKNIVDQSV